MRKKLGLTLLLLLVLSSMNVKAKVGTCHDDFDKLVRLVEENYAGYTDNDRKSIELIQQQIAEKIKYQQTLDCRETLSEWLSAFNDPHLYLSPHNDRQTIRTNIKPATLSTVAHWPKNVVLLSLPTFELYTQDLSLAVKPQHKMALEEAEGLIVDLRGNQEGNYVAMLPLLELIGTTEYHSRWHVLASPANHSHYQKIAAKLDETNLPEVKAMYTNLLAKMAAYPNTLVEYTWPKIERNETLKKIKHIYIVIDGTTAKLAEEFVIAARSNQNVTIMGTNTRGALDYGEAISHSLISDQFQVLIPSQKRVWYQYGPIDNKGLEPDVYLSIDGERLISYIYELMQSQLNH